VSNFEAVEMTICVGGCPPARIDKFLLADAYANCWRLFRTPASTMLFVLTILYDARQHNAFCVDDSLCCPQHQGFPHFYIIGHFRLLFVFGRNI
jgi:hypothetical protein